MHSPTLSITLLMHLMNLGGPALVHQYERYAAVRDEYVDYPAGYRMPAEAIVANDETRLLWACGLLDTPSKLRPYFKLYTSQAYQGRDRSGPLRKIRTAFPPELQINQSKAASA